MNEAMAMQPEESTPLLIARLDRLPMTRYVWQLVLILSLCGFFEIYEIALTSTLSAGLIHAGLFAADRHGMFGLGDQATFIAATFLGLFVGTSACASIADRFGRRRTLIGSLLWYMAAAAIMATQRSANGLDAWRFVTGIGVGVQLITIDSYIAELVPAQVRGKAFSLSYSFMYLAVPAAGVFSWLLLPRSPWGISGWRYVALFPILAAPLLWLIHRFVPESPRWLISRGKVVAAERVISVMERKASLIASVALAVQKPTSGQGVPMPAPSMFQSPYLRRTVMLLILNIFQALGYYGFNNWVPALLASQGIDFVKSLQYSLVIALVYPLTPLFCVWIADRLERKWMIVAGAIGTAVFGLAFARQVLPQNLIVFGALVTISNIVLSYSYHAYQTELYPTRIRARAIGFVYSFSRLATILSGFVIAFALRQFGASGVFFFIAGCMFVVVVFVGALGPRTNGVALDGDG
jgi:MFS transporter, putative metabolite:H+ symporter